MQSMSTYNEIRHILAQVSGHDRVVTIPKMYIELTGNLAEAILLNQIVFYSDKSSRKDGFFYKTHEQWAEEICLSKRQVRHATKKLKEKQLIETKLLKANGAPTVHYKLLFDNLVNWILTKRQNGNSHIVSNDPDITSETLTESTTENTSENNNLDNARVSQKSAFRFFEENGFGLLTPHVADKMGSWIDEVGEDMVLHALEISVENSALRWNYAESILRDWSNKKYKTVADVLAAVSKRNVGRERNAGNRGTAHTSNRNYDGINF